MTPITHKALKAEPKFELVATDRQPTMEITVAYSWSAWGSGKDNIFLFTLAGDGFEASRFCNVDELEMLRDWCDRMLKIAQTDAAEADEKPEPCTLEAERLGCTCRLETVNSASIDPPEPVINQWCPLHGRDPDAEREARRDSYGAAS